MSIGNSGRIVIEVEPATKRALYAALAQEGSTLKEWFLRAAEQYLSGANCQMATPLAGIARSPEIPDQVLQRSPTLKISDTETKKP